MRSDEDCVGGTSTAERSNTSKVLCVPTAFLVQWRLHVCCQKQGKRASEQGDEVGTACLAMCYREGRGVEKN